MEGWKNVASGCLVPLAVLSYLGAVLAFFVLGFSVEGIERTSLWLGVGTASLIAARFIRRKARESESLTSLSLSENQTPFGISSSRLKANSISDKQEIPVGFTERERKALQAVQEDVQKALAQPDFVNVLDTASLTTTVLANPRLQRIAFAVRPTTPQQYAKGVVLEAFTYFRFVVTLLPIALVSKYVSSDVAGAAFKESLSSAKLSIREAKRYRINTHNRLKRDTRPPILYLRSFSSEYANNPDGNDFRTVEEKLDDYYGAYGPMIAIGQPNEKVPLLGPLRLYFDSSNELLWQAGVLYLMSAAQLVIISAGIAPGLLWELGVARQKVNPERLHVSLHEWSGLSDNIRVEHYSRFKKYADVLLGFPLPPYDGVSDFLLFDSSWKPTLAKSSIN